MPDFQRLIRLTVKHGLESKRNDLLDLLFDQARVEPRSDTESDKRKTRFVK